MIDRMLTRRLFIAVNNPWVCDINQDPVKICYDMDYILQEQQLTERLGLRTDFTVEDRYGLFPMYRLNVHLEAIGTTTAIDLGKIIRVDVKNMVMSMIVESSDNIPMMILLPTDCEDLSAREYLLKKNDFEIRNVMTNETDNRL